mmetsp:Transcript_22902/g.38759  ORF Transcript_22902/g.38759 Transcript_22902/m.38759 type:complete len:374 (-) Transcript_22902:2705-3826(-)
MLNRFGSILSVYASYGLEVIGVFTSFSYFMESFYATLLSTPPHDSTGKNTTTITSMGADNDGTSRTEEVESTSTSHRCEDSVNLLQIRNYKDLTSSPDDCVVEFADVDSNLKSKKNNKRQSSNFTDTLKKSGSAIIVAASSVLVLGDIFLINSNKYGHPAISLLLLLVCMIVIFYLEGLQLAVLSMPSFLNSHYNEENFNRAISVHSLILREAITVKRFLIGRQILVVMTTFLASTICSSGDSLSLAQAFGLYHRQPWIGGTTSYHAAALRVICNPNIAEIFFILNMVILPAQLFARKSPMHFLNLCGTLQFLQLSLAIESLGVAHFGWYLFYVTKKGSLSQRYHTTSTVVDDDVDVNITTNAEEKTVDSTSL